MLENVFGVTVIPVITIICYLLETVLKATPIHCKLISPICGAVGGILGLVSMHFMPNFPATDIMTASAIGIVSGLAASGIHQIFKQIGGSANGSNTKDENNTKKNPLKKDEK